MNRLCMTLMSAPWKSGRNGEGTKQGRGGRRLAIASVPYVPHTGWFEEQLRNYCVYDLSELPNLLSFR